MPEFMINRRRLLLQGAALGTGLAAVLGATSGAKAFEQVEMNSNSGLGLAYATRCGGASEHTSIIAGLRTRLAADSSASSATEICPICGCPVTVTR
jgi:hypothetical protein